MSTPSSKKLELATIALAIPLVVYLLGYAGLRELAYWAEAEADSYPYVGGEDPMRFLLPSIFHRPGKGRLMIAGTSGAGEGLLYEDIARAFPRYDVFTAAISGGSIDDVNVALELIVRDYGADSIPEVIVIGAEPRFFANLPRHFGSKQDMESAAPFLDVINRYSGRWMIDNQELGSGLTARPDGRRKRLDFLIRKQQARHRAAVATLLDRMINGRGQTVRLSRELPPVENIRKPFGAGSIATSLAYILEVGPWDAFTRWLPAIHAPYWERYRRSEGLTEFEPGGYLGPVRSWDPESEREMLDAQLGRLRAMKDEHGFRLYFVMLPEHPASLKYYDAKNLAKLDAVVRAAFPETPILDLHDDFETKWFFDQTHTNRAGGEKLTKLAIAFLEKYERSESNDE